MSEGGGVQDYDSKARRVKQLLATYYGTEHHPETDATSHPSTGYGPDDLSSTTSATGTPKLTSIDSPAFNAESYVSSLISTARIDTLMKKHGDMVKEIRALDGDMQMLVYENYNKFITATDTIRSMKSNVDGMGAKMDELKRNMDKVADTSEGVNSKLQKHRDGIVELSRVKTLLQKLQVVMDLPKRMAVAVKEGAFSVVVQDYCETKALLAKYGHQGAFRGVSAECENFIQQVMVQLKEKLRSPDQRAEDCAAMLRKLEVSENELQELYLSGRRSQIESYLQEAACVVQAMVQSYLQGDDVCEQEATFDEKWRDQENKNVTVSSFVKNLDQSILTNLSVTAADFNSTFSVVDPSILSTTLDRSQLVTMAKSLMEDYDQCLMKTLKLASIIGAFNALHLPQEGIAISELSTEEGLEVFTMKVDNDWGATQLSQSLLLVGTDLHMVESRLPELEPNQTMNAVSKACIEYHLSVGFKSLLHRVVGTLIAIKQAAVKSQVSPGSILPEFRMTDLQRVYTHLCDLLLNGFTSLVRDFKNYETDPPLLASWVGSFIDLLQTEIQGLFFTLLNAFGILIQEDRSSNSETQSLLEEIQIGVQSLLREAKLIPEQASELESQFSQGTSGRKCPAGVILLCARLCTFLETNLVPHAVELLATTFPGAGAQDHPSFNPSEVIRRLNSGGNELLQIYINTYGYSLGLMIRQSIAAANWLNHKEPRAPRPICDLIIRQLELAEREIVQLVDDGGNRSRRNIHAPPQHQHSISTTSVDIIDGSDGTALERNVAKLFRQRVQLGQKPEFTHSSIQASILSSSLKSLIECTRQKTFGRAGLQQMQLDVFYLRPQVARFVRGKESDSVNVLLEEVVAAAVERSLDPTLLETAVIDRILTATDDAES